MSKRLKDKLYQTKLALLVGINLFLLGIGISGKELILNVPEIWKNLSSIDLQEGTLIFLLSILAIVLNGIISPEWKFKLIFWKCRNAKPASEAFTKWMFEDDRIDVKALQSKYKNLPTSPKEQNILWYRIYKKHQEKPSVIDAHEKFLLMRDLATISFTFFLLFGLYLLIRGDYFLNSFKILLVFFAEYIGFCIPARNYGTSLVRNVLAEESSEIES